MHETILVETEKTFLWQTEIVDFSDCLFESFCSKTLFTQINIKKIKYFGDKIAKMF